MRWNESVTGQRDELSVSTDTDGAIDTSAVCESKTTECDCDVNSRDEEWADERGERGERL